MSEPQKVCRRCGSVYRITSFVTGMRDKGSINCEVCGEELMSWNGGVMYSAELIEQRGGQASSNSKDISNQQ